MTVPFNSHIVVYTSTNCSFRLPFKHALLGKTLNKPFQMVLRLNVDLLPMVHYLRMELRLRGTRILPFLAKIELVALCHLRWQAKSKWRTVSAFLNPS